MLSIVEILLPLVAVILIGLPLIGVFTKKLDTKKVRNRLIMQVCMFFGVFTLTFIFQLNNLLVYAAPEAGTVNSIAGTTAQGLGFIAAALVTSGSAIGAGIAVAAAAPAAIGAISENEENFGKAMIFVALAEGVAIYGLLISILIINKL